MLTLLILTASLGANPAKLSYDEAYLKAINENKMLFVWQNCKDDYLISQYPNEVHVFNANLPTLIKKGLIVSKKKDNSLIILLESNNLSERSIEKEIRETSFTKETFLEREGVVKNNYSFQPLTTIQSCPTCNLKRK